MRSIYILIPILYVFLTSCAGHEPESGLWVVSKVSMGDQSMTPIARWVELRRDGSQFSGNGWKQHSYGSWKVEGDQLLISTYNQPKDPYGPFTVEMNGPAMRWTRVEESDTVTVLLERIKERPMSPSDSLIGMWNAEGESIWSSVFFRWDGRLGLSTSEGQRMLGYYVPHSHMSQFSYFEGDSCDVQRVDYSFDGDRLEMEWPQGDQSMSITFRRAATEGGN